MKKSKSVFALSIAGATLASAIGITSPAGAFNFVYDNVTYDVNTYTGSFNDLQSTLTAPNNALWGNDNLAYGLAGVVKDDLGYPNTLAVGGNSSFYVRGPFFASYYGAGSLYPSNYRIASGATYNLSPCEFCSSFTSSFVVPVDTTITYATATAVPEPLTILGSIAATAFVAAFNRIKNKKEE
jgi:hypothetical protein